MDDEPSRDVKPAKLLYFEHAERNSIFSAAKNGIKTEGCIMYITLFPCADCARAIIQSGIKKVVCNAPENWSGSWKDSFNAAKEMLSEAKIELMIHM